MSRVAVIGLGWFLDRAFDLGVTFFDTADTYGNGRGEDVLKLAFPGSERHRITIGTKFGYDWKNKKTLDQALAKKAQDEANLANARLDLARGRELVRTQSITQQTVDTRAAAVRRGAAGSARRAHQLGRPAVRRPRQRRPRSLSRALRRALVCHHTRGHHLH